ASVIYNFVGTEANSTPTVSLSFQLTVPTFVNPPLDGPPVVFACSQLDSQMNLLCPGVGNTVQFSNNSSQAPNSAIVFLIDGANAGDAWFFPAGALGSVGVYTASGNRLNTGTLTVSQTPEPSTLLLIGAGGLSALIIRKRISRRASVSRSESFVV